MLYIEKGSAKESYRRRVVAALMIIVGLVLIMVTILGGGGGGCGRGSRINEVFFVSKTCSGDISLVLLPHFSDFGEVHGVIRQLSLLIPVPKLWH